MEEDRIQKFLDLILNEHYCEDCNELCSTGKAFPLEFVAKYIIKIKKENEELRAFKEETLEINNKEATDALHMLLHCSLKDTEYETQKEQFEIVNSYIKQLEEENMRLNTRKILGRIDEIKIEDLEDVLSPYYIPKTKIIEVIEKLKFLNETDREWVVRYEAKRRTTNDEFYKKSYQTTIHKLNAARETRGGIIGMLKKNLESEE